ncbi:molybdopterin-guanine dinucleotide biosynthesis protein A [Virgibacillus natechei]|uniref:Probable molybdenum cofactor guanylyltransferase n=1 Tax=Virgibacillus natechei TaxID=1216297 RepID=A0ABS4IIS6_9BACI|nr:molybdenum cofactor guanylyltransferase [Virgibacillus natechei]MBP1969894.1 molybdopterin-guanine dinucleotide biosynthesis protein A [Virgibacillus natechei]UZD13440.1 molybdenum cofactor guanylyltransferase [Virgibacillus natechei]
MTGKIQGVILAGGMSRRFGSPKAFAEKDGIPFYQYSIDALKPFVNSIIIVTNPRLKHLFKQEDESMKVVNDLDNYRGEGPLAGIYTAMETSNAAWYIVTPIDVPFMETRVINELVYHIDADVDAIIPIVSGKMQPLISIFHHSIKEVIKSQLDNGERSVDQLLKRCKVNYVPMDGEKAFININHQSDYQKFL